MDVKFSMSVPGRLVHSQLSVFVEISLSQSEIGKHLGSGMGSTSCTKVMLICNYISKCHSNVIWCICNFRHLVPRKGLLRAQSVQNLVIGVII